METDFEARALDLLDEALDVPDAERGAWLDRRCAGDPPLRARLDRLLGAHRSGAVRTGAAAHLAAPEPPPERIGAYRVTGLIGQGGMGAVYRGERALGDFEHTAAIKLIRPGALSTELADRFRRERQTLARLSHPNIARLFDGGETEAGQPYLVMELVEGQPLDAWLAAERPPLRARLGLFLKICDAVAHAHRNLVIHRDLTPANVLVDAAGEPRVIDFGIARPAGEAGARRRTATPGFAPPETAAGAPATTLTDVFALGRLLARLTEGDPHPDLSAIVQRASAADPAARYPTTEALSDDVRRFLENRPVRARGGGAAYVFRRFVARNRLAVAAAAAVLLALVGGLVLTLAANARTEAARAAEARRFDQLRALASYMIFGLNDRLARVAGNTAARADIAAQAQRYLDALAASPGAPPALKLETARGLIELARVQGVPTEPNLGDAAAATRNLAAANRLLAEAPAGPENTLQRALARAYEALVLLHAQGDQARAGPALADAERLLAAVPPATPAAAQARRVLRKARLEYADLANRRDDIPALADAMERDIAAWPPALAATDAPARDRALATYYRALHASGTDLERAIALHLQARRGFDALLARAPNDPALLYTAAWNAMDGFAAASRAGRETLSNALILEARDRIDRARAIDDRDRAVLTLQTIVREGLAQNLRDADRFAEAQALQAEVVAARRLHVSLESNPRTRGNLGFSLAIQGVIAANARDRGRACASWTEAAAVLAALQAQGTILGFHAAFLPGIRRNIALCRAGAPTTAFKPLRD